MSQYPSFWGERGGKEKHARGVWLGFVLDGRFFLLRIDFGLVWFGVWLARAGGGGEEGIYCCLRIYCVLDFAGESRVC